MVDYINDIIQIYSKDRLFFLGKPPILTDYFRQAQFLVHVEKIDSLIEMLEDLTGVSELSRLAFRNSS